MSVNDPDHGCYLPTAKEIRDGIREAQSHWSPGTEISRAGGNSKLYMKEADGTFLAPVELSEYHINRSNGRWLLESDE